MAITRHSNFDKTVQTIADRNNIANKVNGMMVVVLDAIADPNVGSGKAIYRFDSSDSSWILVSKSTSETMNFVTEELTIVNNEAQLSYIPVDNQVWNGVILNGQLIYADLNLNAITIAGGKITGLTNEVNGLTLRVTYAYGTIAQQVITVIEESVDAALIDSLKTINGESIIGTGDILISGSGSSGFTIASTEFNTGNKRGSKDIFGIEIDTGTLVNESTKEISFTFNALYTYWIDDSNSYCSNNTSSYPINYVGNIGESISCFLDRTNNKIKISCSDNKTSFTGKIVILYTK